jgi:hypothetical protein
MRTRFQVLVGERVQPSITGLERRSGSPPSSWRRSDRLAAANRRKPPPCRLVVPMTRQNAGVTTPIHERRARASRRGRAPPDAGTRALCRTWPDACIQRGHRAPGGRVPPSQSTYYFNVRESRRRTPAPNNTRQRGDEPDHGSSRAAESRQERRSLPTASRLPPRTSSGSAGRDRCSLASIVKSTERASEDARVDCRPGRTPSHLSAVSPVTFGLATPAPRPRS